MEKFYYRCKEVLWSRGNGFLEPRVTVHINSYRVLDETKCGAWIEDFIGHRKFVLNGARNSWARPTKEEAIISFRARKRRQIKILKAQLEIAEAAFKAEIDGENK